MESEGRQDRAPRGVYPVSRPQSRGVRTYVENLPDYPSAMSTSYAIDPWSMYPQFRGVIPVHGVSNQFRGRVSRSINLLRWLGYLSFSLESAQIEQCK